MAAGAGTVEGKAWGPLRGPAEHTGASLGVKTVVNVASAQDTISLKSILYLFGWHKRKSMVKAIALTDSTLLRFPSSLQPRKLKDKGEVAPQSNEAQPFQSPLQEFLKARRLTLISPH